MAIKVFNIPKLARNKYNYVKEGTTVVSGSSSADIDTSNLITTEWFYKDEKGNIHCPENFVGDKSVSVYEVSEDGTPSGGNILVLIPTDEGKVLTGVAYENNVLSFTKGDTNWTDVKNKPFETIGTGLKVENNVLIAEGGGGHTHDNKTVLDGITSTKVSHWDTAYTNNHIHSNKTTLDGISSTDVNNWDSAYADSHWHTNKSVLDGITSAKVSNWNTAYDDSHTHTNKSVLDNLTQAQLNFINNLMNHVTIGTNKITFDVTVVSEGNLTAYN